MNPSFALVGCGKAGTALAKHLMISGYPLKGLTDIDSTARKRAEAVFGKDKVYEDPLMITGKADIVFMTTPDSVIEPVCKAISDKGGFRENSIVLHISGSLPSTVLSGAKENKAVIGSIHPLQSLASAEGDTNPFDGIVMSIEGEEKAVAVCKRMALALGANPIEIRTEAKTLYHASAVVASNYLVTVLDMALSLLERAGIERTQGFKVLKPLVDGTLSNIARTGIPKALTGPVERGDKNTVIDHMRAMEKMLPEVLPLYRLLGSYTAKIAEQKGSLSEEEREIFDTILHTTQ